MIGLFRRLVISKRIVSSKMIIPTSQISIDPICEFSGNSVKSLAEFQSECREVTRLVGRVNNLGISTLDSMDLENLAITGVAQIGD